MSKFFSLINSEQLLPKAGVKVIPGDSIATLLTAEEMLKIVQVQTEEYKKKIACECEELKEGARRQGFEEGYTEWTAKIADLEAEIKKVRKETENLIFPIALKAAKKIIGRELELSKTAIIDIISNSLKAVATHKRIKLHVNKKDHEIVEKYKEQLKKIFEQLETLSIIPSDSIEPAGCIIETEGGIINAQLENQWMILENAFEKLARTRKETEEAQKPDQALLQKSTPEPSKEEENIKAPAPDQKEDEEEEEWEDEDEEWEDE